MNVLRCVQWMVDVWKLDMKDLAMANCFRKSTVKAEPNGDVTAELLEIGDETFYYNDMADKINVKREIYRLQ